MLGFRSGPNAHAVTLRYMRGGDAAGARGAPHARTVALARDVADALAYLHGVGVVHRDVKLSNVLLDEQGARTWRTSGSRRLLRARRRAASCCGAAARARA